jgi:hypothetical protein
MTPQAAWELQYNSATREEKTIFNGLVEAVEEEIRGVSSYYHCFSNSKRRGMLLIILSTIIASATLSLFLKAFLPGLGEMDKETIPFRVQTQTEATQTNG